MGKGRPLTKGNYLITAVMQFLNLSPIAQDCFVVGDCPMHHRLLNLIELDPK